MNLIAILILVGLFATALRLHALIFVFNMTDTFNIIQIIGSVAYMAFLLAGIMSWQQQFTQFWLLSSLFAGVILLLAFLAPLDKKVSHDRWVQPLVVILCVLTQVVHLCLSLRAVLIML